ncbi:glycosyl hydrolase family 65 protein [Bacillus sp. AL-1R]
MLNMDLRISPRIPADWESLEFTFIWHGDEVKVRVTREEVWIEKVTSVNEFIRLRVFDEEYVLKSRVYVRVYH